jgi:hypothetical protein
LVTVEHKEKSAVSPSFFDPSFLKVSVDQFL